MVLHIQRMSYILILIKSNKFAINKIKGLLEMQQIPIIVGKETLMNQKNDVDIRTIRTRQLILDSFKKLLNEKSFEAIRISDITNEAMINRATFYNYFTDKYQLLDTLTEETLLVQIRKKLDDNELFSPEFVKKIYLSLTNFHSDMSHICKKNYIEELALYTSQVLREEITRTLVDSLVIKFPKEKSDALERLAAILSWYIIGLAYEWKRSKQNSAEEFFNHFRDDYERLIVSFKP